MIQSTGDIPSYKYNRFFGEVTFFFLSMFSKIYKTQHGVGTVFEQVYCSRCPIWIPTLLSRFFLPWWPRSASWPHSSTILTRQSLARMEQQWFSKRYVCFHKYSIEIEIEGWVKRKIGKHAVNMTLMRLFFLQYAGYLFVGVGHQEECHLQRLISMTIRMVQLVVGPCVTM